jgi:hypothetical protein
MAKVNTSITAAANVLALINAANPSLNATEAQITAGVPTTAAGTGGRNTAITYTAVDNQGFSGTQTFSYTRRALASGEAIAAAKAIPVVIAEGDTDAQVKTKVAVALGLIESEIALSDIVRPADESTPGSADVDAIANSLLYTGTYAVTLTVPDADVPLDEAASVTDLDGFDAEG